MRNKINKRIISFLNSRLCSLMPKEGFTLVELIVAIGLFTVLVTLAVGGFSLALRTQRQAAALLAANTNVSEALEQMAREIRTGSNFCDNNGPDLNGVDHDCGGVNSVLIFTNSKNQTVTYHLEPGAVSLGVIERDVVGDLCVPPTPCIPGQTLPESGPITGENVLVHYLHFVLNGTNLGGAPESPNFQPRVTISLGVSPFQVALQNFITNLQVTVSSRQPD